MKKISKIIVILIVVMLIIIISITTLKGKIESESKEKLIKIDETSEQAEKNIELHIEEDRNRFYVVKNCVEQFFEYYQYLNTENLDIEISDEEIDVENLKKWYEEKVYAILDKEYINYKGITSNNVSEKLGEIGKTKVIVDKVYTKDLENSSYICFVEGRIKEEHSNMKQLKMVVKLSPTNTFKIFLEDYLVEKGYYNFTNDIDITQLCKNEITHDKYNTYKSKAITSEDYLNDLFAHYKTTVINDEEFAYQLIDEKYKSVRFENIKEYTEYVKSNYSKIVLTQLSGYNQITLNGINQYVCKDNYNNYYIFKEIAPFQYTVILDNYTIPTEEFSKKYNSSSEAEKVILNIKRFFMGIDAKNYGYSYSVLSGSFKDNKYPSKNDFINYAKQNFFEENQIEYISYEKENSVYIYKIKITDATGKSTEEKEFNIILKLNQGTDFEMSFGEN